MESLKVPAGLEKSIMMGPAAPGGAHGRGAAPAGD